MIVYIDFDNAEALADSLERECSLNHHPIDIVVDEDSVDDDDQFHNEREACVIFDKNL